MSKERSGARERWAERIAEQERSGLKVSEYCRQHGISYISFFVWRRRLREANAPRFLEVSGASAASGSETRIEVRLSHGRSLLVGRGFDAECLRALVGILEEPR